MTRTISHMLHTHWPPEVGVYKHSEDWGLDRRIIDVRGWLTTQAGPKAIPLHNTHNTRTRRQWLADMEARFLSHWACNMHYFYCWWSIKVPVHAAKACTCTCGLAAMDVAVWKPWVVCPTPPQSVCALVSFHRHSGVGLCVCVCWIHNTGSKFRLSALATSLHLTVNNYIITK